MNQEVKYNGYSATPSDYECPDGDLADVINLIPEDGALRLIVQPKAIFSHLEHDILFVHEATEYTHYIGKDSNGLYWLLEGEEQSATLIYDFGAAEILQVTAVGNTLVILTSEGVKYALWKAENNGYSYLGEMPECPISFGLQGETRYYSKMDYDKGENGDTEKNGRFKISYDRIDSLNAPLSESNKKTITNQVLAKVNRFISEVSTSENRFIFPFFVRYAYRLYDGSLSKHSAPVLMLPCTKVNPQCFIFTPLDRTESEADLFTISTLLDYQALISENEKKTLEAWGDIIKSVDFFVSAPIYTYDQSGECELIRTDLVEPSRFVGKFKTDKKRDTNDDSLISLYYQSWSHSDLCGYENDAIGFLSSRVILPSFSDEDVEKKLRECSSFFLLSSIEIGKLSTTRTEVPIEDGSLGALTAHEVMTDDYQTHDTIIAKRAFGYNGRLNLSGVQRRLFEGINLSAMTCYVNGRNTLSWRAIEGTGEYPLYFSESEGGSILKLYWELSTESGSYILESESMLLMSTNEQDYNYLYYPDVTAKKLSFVGSRDWQHGMSRLAEPHPTLNGSLCYRSLNSIKPSSPADEIPDGSNNANAFVNALNKVYTSEINNPFFFPLLGINTISSGEVLGISSAAKALSQGQFGQFPLYAFTTEGVWALEVASNGSYIARQPITRDVCINPESITQIDSAVLFATNRGIMLLSGSETICITDILDSKEAFSIHSMPMGEDISSIAFPSYNGKAFDRVLFKEYLQKCSMLYDYSHQRIIVFNPDYEYAYVYSLESKQWGLMFSDIAHAIPSYPNALAMSKAGSPLGVLWDFSKGENSPSDRGLLITRPLKFGSHDILKTIDSVIQRGQFKAGHVQMVLYGSRDLVNWFVVASSKNHYLRGFRGTPYKYFRVAVICDLEPQESLYGCSVQFETRQTNQPR